jgi:hypothetical protein
MRKIMCASLLGVAAFAGGSQAFAWGLHAGETIGSGDNLVYGEAGWPDVSLGIQHGINDSIDIGGRLSLSYGPVGTVQGAAAGLGLRAPIRISIMKGETLSLYVHVDPGINFATFSPVLFGMQFPIGIEAGYHIDKKMTVSAGFDMPFYLNFTQTVFFVIPPMAGPGFEYHLDEHMTAGINTRFGAAIGAGGGNTFPTAFAMIVQAGFGYRL